MQKFDSSVYFIADPAACKNRDINDITKLAAQGGVTLVQLRDKRNKPGMIMEQAHALAEILKPYNIPLIINDHVEIAREFDGVHLGQEDMPAAQARKILGPNKIIGVTAFEVRHFENIDPAIVDYVGTGPFYPTLTKPGKRILGADNFKKLCAISPVPVVGIGGINPDNAANVIKAGTAGVAMMRGISESADPEKAARDFVKAVADARR